MPDVVGAVIENSPDAIALLFAVSSLPTAVAVLPADPRAWRSDPPFPPGMPVVLSPASASLAPQARAAGLRDVPLAEPAATGPPPPFFTGTGLVAYTSGSTGAPRPVFHRHAKLLAQTATLAAVFQLPRGARIAASLPLSAHFGLGHAVLLAAYLDGELGLLESFNHRSLLALFAAAPHDYWAGTPLMVDHLARAPLADAPPRVPPICFVSSGRLPGPVYRRFTERFGVRPRLSYGRTECGLITAEAQPAPEPEPEAIGAPSPGVEVRCGDDPERPLPAEATGLVWIRAPWHMEGYGYPPSLSPPPRADGWWPTQDLGSLGADGRLRLLGRTDECFKTHAGYLVDPAAVADALRAAAGVADVVVVPVAGPDGPVIGAVVAALAGVGEVSVHARAAEVLPTWLRPAVLAIVPELPRLVGGKPDRQACIAMLEPRRSGAPPHPNLRS
jgi:fatty acid CoA ligase FadD36